MISKKDNPTNSNANQINTAEKDDKKLKMKIVQKKYM